MKVRAPLAVLLALSAAACAEQPVPEPEATAVSDMGELHDVVTGPLSDFVIRLDSERDDPVDFQLTEDDAGVHIVTGPAGIAYHPEEVIDRGDFRVDATFTQFGAAVGYREAFGLFVGGRELESPDLEYTYFLVRTTGDYLVKRRVGDITEVIVDWTPHEAITRVEVEGDEPQNTLIVEVEDGQINFIVNGQLAHSMAASAARPYGVAGLRANHRLDVRVTAWSLQARGTTE